MESENNGRETVERYSQSRHTALSSLDSPKNLEIEDTPEPGRTLDTNREAELTQN